MVGLLEEKIPKCRQMISLARQASPATFSFSVERPAPGLVDRRNYRRSEDPTTPMRLSFVNPRENELRSSRQTILRYRLARLLNMFLHLTFGRAPIVPICHLQVLISSVLSLLFKRSTRNHHSYRHKTSLLALHG